MRQYVLLLREHPWVTPVIVALVIGFQAFTMVPHMTEHDKYPDYWHNIIPSTFKCDVFDFKKEGSGYSRAPLKFWLNCVSFHITGSPNYLPIALNMGIMPMTYLLATRMTNDRIIGLIALVTLINIPLYNDWKTSGTYDMGWALFLLLSVYFLYSKTNNYTKYPKAPEIFFIISAAFKSLTLMYLPAWIYSARKNDKTISIVFVGVAIVSVLLMVKPEVIVGNSIGFYPEHWEQALFRNISLLWQIIPLMMGLAVLYAGFKGKSPQGMKDVSIWILWIILTTPIIHLFTMQLTFSYRFIVLGVFLSILCGQVIVRVGNWYMQSQMSKSFISHY